MRAQLVSFGNYLLKTYGVNVHSTDGSNQPLYQREVSHADLENWEHENPQLEDGGVPFKAHTKYPSRYALDEKVKVFLMPEGAEDFPGFTGIITAIHFTNGKVKYDVEIKFYGDHSTRIYNLDSILIQDLDFGKPKEVDGNKV